MPRPPKRSVPVVLVPGWGGSGPGHWQQWLAEQLREAGREVRLLDLPDADHPRLATWLDALDAGVAGLPDGGYDLLTHSLGGVLWLHRATDAPEGPHPERAALVAPPSPQLDEPEIAEFLPPPMNVDAIRRAADGTVLVCGDDDPSCPEGADVAYGRPLKMPTTVIPGAGHLNVESGHGPWPAVLAWCERDKLAFF